MYLDKPIVMREKEIIEIKNRIEENISSDDVESQLALSVLKDALSRGKIFKDAGTEPVYIYVGQYKIDVVSKLLLDGKLH